MSTTAELFNTLNTLRVAAGKTALKAWKESRAKLEAAIAKEMGRTPEFEASQAELAAQIDRQKVIDAKTPKVEEVDEAPKASVGAARSPKKAAVDRETKKGDVWLTELCTRHSLHPKVARAKLRRLYAGDTKSLPALQGRWSWKAADVPAVIALLKKAK